MPTPAAHDSTAIAECICPEGHVWTSPTTITRVMVQRSPRHRARPRVTYHLATPRCPHDHAAQTVTYREA